MKKIVFDDLENNQKEKNKWMLTSMKKLFLNFLTNFMQTE